MYSYFMVGINSFWKYMRQLDEMIQVSYRELATHLTHAMLKKEIPNFTQKENE
jgi:hypothetical protein